MEETSSDSDRDSSGRDSSDSDSSDSDSSDSDSSDSETGKLTKFKHTDTNSHTYSRN